MALRVDDVAEVILPIDTAAYAAGDLMSLATEVERVCVENHPSYIVSLTVLDYDDQGGDIDLLVFRTHPGVLGVVNAPIAITNAQAQEILCCVLVRAADYIDLGAQRLAQPEFYARKVRPADGQTSLWVAAVCRTGQVTYPSGRLLLKVGTVKEE